MKFFLTKIGPVDLAWACGVRIQLTLKLNRTFEDKDDQICCWVYEAELAESLKGVAAEKQRHTTKRRRSGSSPAKIAKRSDGPTLPENFDSMLERTCDASAAPSPRRATAAARRAGYTSDPHSPPEKIAKGRRSDGPTLASTLESVGLGHRDGRRRCFGHASKGIYNPPAVPAWVSLFCGDGTSPRRATAAARRAGSSDPPSPSNDSLGGGAGFESADAVRGSGESNDPAVLQREMAMMRTTIDLQAKLLTSQQCNALLKETNQALVEEKRKLDGVIQVLQGQKDAKLKSDNEAIQAQDERNRSTERDLERERERLRQLENAQSELEQENRKLKEQARERQDELEALNQYNETSETLRSDLETGTKAHQNEVLELQRQLKGKTNQYDEVRSKLETVESELKHRNNEWDLLTDARLRDRDALTQKEKQIKDNEKTIKYYKDKLESLKKELEDVRQPLHPRSRADAFARRTVQVENGAAVGSAALPDRTTSAPPIEPPVGECSVAKSHSTACGAALKLPPTAANGHRQA